MFQLLFLFGGFCEAKMSQLPKVENIDLKLDCAV